MLPARWPPKSLGYLIWCWLVCGGRCVPYLYVDRPTVVRLPSLPLSSGACGVCPVLPAFSWSWHCRVVVWGMNAGPPSGLPQLPLCALAFPLGGAPFVGMGRGLHRLSWSLITPLVGDAGSRDCRWLSVVGGPSLSCRLVAAQSPPVSSASGGFSLVLVAGRVCFTGDSVAVGICPVT